MKVRSPFNFVPFANEVFFPYWAEMVTMDIPFKEGMSGYIDVTLEARSPLFIRNGHGRDDKDIRFSHVDVNGIPRYYIPATSVKGMVRNVFSIMSFSKMRIDRNAAFAQREWNNPVLYPLKKTAYQDVFCGWLKLDEEGRYVIRKSKGLYRIALPRIQDEFNCNFKSKFAKGSGFAINKETYFNGKEYDPKTARFKYAMLADSDKDRRHLTELRFSVDRLNTTSNGMPRLVFDNSGPIKGYLVLTGQSAQAKWVDASVLDNPDDDRRTIRKMGDGKFYEFVFDSEIVAEYEIDESLFDQYDQYIYAKSDDWKDGKCKMMGKGMGMPVFFSLKKVDGVERIANIGLAYLYKLPYENTPLDKVKSGIQRWDKDYDLTELVFGHIGNEDDSALRGRVSFSHFWGENCVEGKELKLTLSSPKPSYYPIYISQDGSGSYKTLNDGQISGWKRYVLKDTVLPVSTSDSQDSSMIPLDKGTFKGRIAFHNLLPVELGALLSALTFHGTEGCLQQIGQGKPYGLGAVELDIATLNVREGERSGVLSQDDILGYMADFEACMQMYGIDWRNSQTIRELLILSSTINSGNDRDYHYMQMSTVAAENEFLNVKKEKAALMPFSRTHSLKKEFGVKASLVDEKRKGYLATQEDMDKRWREYAEKGEFDNADRMVRLIKKVNPNFEDVSEELDYMKSKGSAENLVEKKHYDEAISIYEGLKTQMSDLVIISEIERRISEVHVLKLRSMTEPAAERSLAEILGRLSDLKSVSGQLSGWKKRGNVIGDDELSVIKECVKRIFDHAKPRDKKKLENRRQWDILANVVGKEVVDSWFSEIVESC